MIRVFVHLSFLCFFFQFSFPFFLLFLFHYFPFFLTNTFSFFRFQFLLFDSFHSFLTSVLSLHFSTKLRSPEINQYIDTALNHTNQPYYSTLYAPRFFYTFGRCSGTKEEFFIDLTKKKKDTKWKFVRQTFFFVIVMVENIFVMAYKNPLFFKC